MKTQKRGLPNFSSLLEGLRAKRGKRNQTTRSKDPNTKEYMLPAKATAPRREGIDKHERIRGLER